jgi:uncharacterized repeat protein (TIGR01451 family)
MEAAYTVTAEDVVAGSVVNVATATAETPDESESDGPTIIPGEDEEQTQTMDITITTIGEKVTYDGEEHGADVTITGLPEGYTYTAVSHATATDVTEEPVEADCDFYEIRDAEGNVVTDAFEVADRITDTIVINPRPITIKAADAEKVYSETALTADDSSIVEGELVEGHSYTAVVVGSQKLVGSSGNVITGVVITENSSASSLMMRAKAVVAEKDVTSNYDITLLEGTLTVTDVTSEEPVNPNKVVTKTHEDKEYGLGDTVTFTVSATNIYDTAKTITLREIEGVTLEQSVFENVAPGETVTTSASYVITEADILAGSFINTIEADFDGEKTFKNTDEVELEEAEGHMTITKTTTSEPANGEAYALGETITYEITVTNDGNLTLTDITVTDELTGNIGDNAWTIDTLAPDDSRSFTAEYVVTEADVLAGSVKNVATATGSGSDGEEPEVDPGEKEEPVSTPNPSLYVEKSAEQKEGGYALGDEIPYTIRVINNGSVTVSDITVTDELTGMEKTIEALEPNKEEKFTTIYTVTEEDILAGSIVNVATVSGTDPNGEPVENEGEETVTTEEKSSHMTITKTTTSTPENGSAYALGETITYAITVTNDGNLTLTDITVTDELTGNTGDNAWTIDTLAPGESERFTAEYVVTEKDILAGSVKNVATVSGTDPNGEPVENEGEKTITTEEKNGHMMITKTTTSTPENGSAYALGETITYEITVANDGNLTLTDIIVTDELTGNTGDNAWTIDTLEPNESERFTAEYVVTEEDILAGSIVNVATVSGTDPNGEPVENEGEETVTTEEKNGHMMITKTTTSEPANGEAYVLGETITYEITVASDGNLTLTDITVTDELTGNTGDNAWTIDTLAPGESERFTAEYVVTEADVIAGSVKNVATVSGTDPNGEPVENEGEKTITTEEKNGHMTITKTTTSEPANGEAYALGETITYAITVTNDGNLTLTDITVTDELTGNTGDNAWTIDTLAPGATETMEVSYTVTVEAAATGSIVNVATVSGIDLDDNNIEAEDSVEVPTEVPAEDSYTGSIVVTKQLINLSGDLITLGDADFYVALFQDEAFTQRIGDVQTLTFGSEDREVSTVFEGLQQGVYYIAETDEAGDVLGELTEYKDGIFLPVYTTNSAVITADGETAQFVFANEFLILPNVDLYKTATRVSITKEVRDVNGEEMASEETFYAGIFTDEHHTQLASEEDGVQVNIIPIDMAGKSSVTVTVDIEYQEETAKTLYIAEVSEDGTPVELLEDFDYDSEVLNGAFLLEEDNAEATVTIINTSNKEIGSSDDPETDNPETDDPETDNSETDDPETDDPEGDTEVTPTAVPTVIPTAVPTIGRGETAESEETTASLGVKTGDESPVLPFALMLAGSGILLLIVEEERRRRAHK